MNGAWYPWKRQAWVAVACLALAVVAFALGRHSAPTRVVTQTVTVEKRVEVAAKVADTAVSTDKGVQWRERVVYRPGGVTVVTRETVRADTATATTHAAETHAVTAEHAAATLRIIERPRLAQWSLGAFAGAGLDGSRHAGGEVSRRLFGPIWLGAQVDAVARAGTLHVRLEF